MEWGVKENRIAVIALHKCGKTASEIHELLKNLKISRMFVYRAINRFSQTSEVTDRKRSGRPRVARTSAAITAVREKIRKSPLTTHKIMSEDLNISARSLARLIKDDLHMKSSNQFRLKRRSRKNSQKSPSKAENHVQMNEHIDPIHVQGNEHIDPIHAQGNEHIDPILVETSDESLPPPNWSAPDGN